jgi:squalene-associated FAD-dependent desaturase
LSRAVDDALVIGGGLAGLAAAVDLAGAGAKVTLIEARPHLGGRAFSFVDRATGDVVDNGQHLMMGCYHHAFRFLELIGSFDLLAFQPALHLTFLEAGREPLTLHCPPWPAPWGLLAGLGRMPGLSLGDRLRMLAVGCDLLSPIPRWRDKLTVEAWLSALGQTAGVRRVLWDPLTLATLNESPAVAGAEHLATVLRRAFLDSRLVLPRVGLSQLYTEQARAFIEARGGQVRLRTGAVGLQIGGGRVSGVRLRGGELLRAGSVISAIPYDALARLILPQVLEPAGGLKLFRPSPIISIHLWLDRAVTGLEFAGLLGTEVQWLFNKRLIWQGRGGYADFRSLRDFGSLGDYLSLVISSAGELLGLRRENLVEMALRELRELLPGARQATLRHALVVKERAATFSPTAGCAQYRPGPRTPLENLFLAGDWTATGLPASIEGAVQSGQTCAALVLR